MRTFIAIELDSFLKKKLEEFIQRLRPKGGDVRWVKPEGMHLTLKFLGETGEESAARVKRSLERVARHHSPFRLVLSGTGAFPAGRQAPRVLWVGFEENAHLRVLQEEIEKEMEELGFAREERVFHPHLTLGRVKSPFRLGSLLDEFKKETNTVFGEMVASHLTYFQSFLKPSGAEYIVLAEYPLG